jgi:hypothetical protein
MSEKIDRGCHPERSEGSRHFFKDASPALRDQHDRFYFFTPRPDGRNENTSREAAK